MNFPKLPKTKESERWCWRKLPLLPLIDLDSGLVIGEESVLLKDYPGSPAGTVQGWTRHPRQLHRQRKTAGTVGHSWG